MINITQEQIMQNWEVDNSDTPLVSVKCMTYNHEKYISQALDGFLMQKTSFPFEVLVHDDASTDKTADIIHKYESKFPKIVKGIYEKENQWSKGDRAHHRKIDALIKGKYIAICEGDDYWIDEYKLQKQVHFLEENSDYVMCYTCAKMFYQNENSFSNSILGESVNDFEDILRNGNKIPTLTVCYRKDLYFMYLNEIHPENKKWKMGDYPLWLYFAHEKKIKYFNMVSSVYRVLENSASHNTDINKLLSFNKNVEEIRLFFSKKYNIPIELKSDDDILYKVLFELLLKKYNKVYAKEFRKKAKLIKNNSFKMKIFYFVSHNSFLWNFLQKIIYIKNRLYSFKILNE